MHRLLVLTTAAWTALAAPAAAQPPVGKLAKAKGWYTSYDAGRAAARQTGKPLLVVFRCEP